MNKVKMYFIKTVLPAVVLSSLAMLSVIPAGCRSSVDGISFLTGDFSVPKILSFHVDSSSSLMLDFSKPVSVKNCQLSAAGSGNPIEMTYECDDENSLVRFNLMEGTSVGKSYVLDAEVCDKSGNSVTFSIPFAGYNDRIPLLVISEIRNAYGSVSVNKEKIKKGEFVELLALSDGNLSGLEVFSAGDGYEKKVPLPPAEVKRGQYITVHLRNIDTYSGMVTEVDDLKASTAVDSCSSALDVWSGDDGARLASSDIVVLNCPQEETVLDAVPFAQKEISAWSEAYRKTYEAVEKSGVWQNEGGEASCSVQDSVCSDGMNSVNRSLSRQNCRKLLELTASLKPGEKLESALPNSKADWMLTAKVNATKTKAGDDGVTPGYANSSNRYVAK